MAGDKLKVKLKKAKKYSTEIYVRHFFDKFYKDSFSVDRYPDYCERFSRFYQSALLSEHEKEYIKLHFYLLYSIKSIPNGHNRLVQLNRKINSLIDRGLNLLSQNWVENIESLEAHLDVSKTDVEGLDISVLNVGTQCENALRREGINYIGQLKSLSLDDLTSIRGINLTYTDFIYNELEKLGIHIDVPYVQKYNGSDDVNFRLRVLSFFKDMLFVGSVEAEKYLYSDFDDRLNTIIKSGLISDYAVNVLESRYIRGIISNKEYARINSMTIHQGYYRLQKCLSEYRPIIQKIEEDIGLFTKPQGWSADFVDWLSRNAFYNNRSIYNSNGKVISEMRPLINKLIELQSQLIEEEGDIRVAKCNWAIVNLDTQIKCLQEYTSSMEKLKGNTKIKVNTEYASNNLDDLKITEDMFLAAKDIHISCCLSNGTCEPLYSAGINTLQDILILGKMDIKDITGFGPRKLQEVNRVLNSYGYPFSKGECYSACSRVVDLVVKRAYNIKGITPNNVKLALDSRFKVILSLPLFKDNERELLEGYYFGNRSLKSYKKPDGGLRNDRVKTKLALLKNSYGLDLWEKSDDVFNSKVNELNVIFQKG